MKINAHKVWRLIFDLLEEQEGVKYKVTVRKRDEYERLDREEKIS